MKKYVFMLLFLLFTSLAEAGGRILFVPLDDRPVCLDYTVDTFRTDGWAIETPPRDIIASFDHNGDPEKLYAWLENNATGSSAVVVSSDSMIYGGLVASRTHKLSEQELAERTTRLLQFKQKFGSIPVYVFTTVMRSPETSSAPFEPAYYKEYGSRIFRLGQLTDKNEVVGLTKSETKEKLSLGKTIPETVLRDLYSRRNKNMAVTERLLAAAENGSFDYLLLGRDDTATYSDAHRDARKLEMINAQLSQRKVRFFTGADQLGMLLVDRAMNKDKGVVPIVHTFYADGVGENTIPAYEDDKVRTTVRNQILAAGAWPAPGDKYADLILAVYTPVDGITLQGNDAANSVKLKRGQQAFLQKVEEYLQKPKNVAIADVAYANGSDNALVKGLFSEKLAWSLAAYAGWNTAANTIGYAIVQGLQAPYLKLEDKNDLLLVRYLDEWAYQSNVRGIVRQEVVWPRQWKDGAFLPEQKQILESTIADKIRSFVNPYITAKTISEWRFTLPWNRTFEIKIEKR
ncbi:MAG: DUF4127 family protein [Acidaminococcaceae bacterium]